MKPPKFSQHQIISTLKEVDSGQEVSDVYRQHGISQSTCLSMERQMWKVPRLRTPKNDRKCMLPELSS